MPCKSNAAAAPLPAALSIGRAAREASLSRRTIDREIAAGRLDAIRVGARTLIRAEAFTNWLSSRPAAWPATARQVPEAEAAR
jgi:excisionase family DNA binding protein